MVSNTLGAFQQVKEQAEKQVVLHLLSALDKNPETSQRKLASDLGIALGLINTYLKKCVIKGWVRASQVSTKRLGYFLTPEGFAEKSHMVKDYLSRSLGFFRDARIQCESILNHCKANGMHKIALVGEGDLSEIACLVANIYSFEIVHTLTPHLMDVDAAIITDVMNPQKVYEEVVNHFDQSKVFTPDVLHISRKSLRVA